VAELRVDRVPGICENRRCVAEIERHLAELISIQFRILIRIPIPKNM
jgi:hypothetical protein